MGSTVGGSVTGSGMILFRLLLLPPFLVVDTGIRWTARKEDLDKADAASAAVAQGGLNATASILSFS